MRLNLFRIKHWRFHQVLTWQMWKLEILWKGKYQTSLRIFAKPCVCRAWRVMWAKTIYVVILLDVLKWQWREIKSSHISSTLLSAGNRSALKSLDLDMPLFFIAHIRMPSAIDDKLSIIVFSVQNAVFSMPMIILAPSTVYVTLSSLAYQKMSAKTICVIYLLIVRRCNTIQHTLSIARDQQAQQEIKVERY